MVLAGCHFGLLLLCIASIEQSWATSLRGRQQFRRETASSGRSSLSLDTCRSVLCPHGTQCVNKEIQCHRQQCPTIAVCEAMKTFPNYCEQAMDPGSCGVGLGYHVQERWFYNSTSAQCQRFDYSGCGGNDNKYHTRQHCERSCVRLEECKLKPEQGPCRARFIRYSYDRLDGVCKTFVYGGCRGNGNNFVTMDACMQKCYVAEFENPDINRSTPIDD